MLTSSLFELEALKQLLEQLLPNVIISSKVQSPCILLFLRCRIAQIVPAILATLNINNYFNAVYMEEYSNGFSILLNKVLDLAKLSVHMQVEMSVYRPIAISLIGHSPTRQM